MLPQPKAFANIDFLSTFIIMQYQHILHIDDDIEDQEIFNSALNNVSDRLKCTSLTSAREALQQLSNHALTPDVIFLDLNMPIMSGKEFLKEIKQIDRLKAIPVIIFSTSSNASMIAETKALGAVDFITKPNRFSELVEILQSVIQ